MPSRRLAARPFGRSVKNTASEIIVFSIGAKGCQKSEPVQFALLKTVASAAPLELILANGEQLRIWNGVDTVTLRLVLDVVRR